MTKYRENKDVRGPFSSTPDARVYFPASTIEKARRTVGRCLRRSEGVALVVGGCGVGKTLLARVLASEFDSDDLVAVVSAARRLDVKSFLQQVLFGLRQTFCGCDETELRLMALDYIERAPQRRCALLIDDAQNLGPRVYDELRALIDQTSALSKQTAVALFGGFALEERLNMPQLCAFQQRIATRSYLEAFTRDETARYIERELERAQVVASFSPEAKEAVARLSDGAPRAINQLCDRALFFALENAAHEAGPETVEIDARAIERAWNDLQNIPDEPRRVESSSSAGSDGVVEFGLLDDDDEDEYNTENTVDSVVEAPVASEVATVAEQPAEQPEESSEEQLEESVSESDDASAEEAPFATIESALDAVAEASKPYAEDADRRRRAKKAFWSVEEEPETASETDASAIDDELDARLRAKFGFDSVDSDESEEEASEPDAVIDENGLRYELNDGANGPSDASGAESSDDERAEGFFDASLTLTRDEGPKFVGLPKSTTRRRIGADADDGSREYFAANGFNAEDYARLAADDRDLDPKIALTNASDAETKLDALDPRARSLDDRIYRQVVASLDRSVSDMRSSDQYLNELQLLEQEITEEANLIRRIRGIHMRLRAANAARPAETSDASERAVVLASD